MKEFKTKDIEKQISDSLKIYAKQFGYKKISFFTYKKYKEYFIRILFNNSNSEIWGTGEVKPYFIDDVFWDVFDMSSNKNEPMSLRANGAFALSGIKVINKRVNVNDSLDEVNEIVKTIFKEVDEKCIKFIDKLGDDVDNYIVIAEKSEGGFNFDINLRKMLFYIKNNSFEKAMDLAQEEISKGNRGHYGTMKKDIYEYVVDYCEKRLSD